MEGPSSNRFSSLLLEGLDHYRRGRMLDAVRSWEEAYLLEPTNLRAREFLRSALERIHARMSATGGSAAQPGVAFQEMQQLVPQVPLERLSGPGVAFRSFERHPWLRPPNETAPGLAPPAAPTQAQAQAATASARAVEAQYEEHHDEPDDAPAVWEPKLAPGGKPAAPYDLGLELAAAAEPPPPPVEHSEKQEPAKLPQAPVQKAAPPPPPEEPPAEKTVITRSPWDDGPSVALPVSDPPPNTERNAGVWKIHDGQTHPASRAPDETGVWMIAADELMALDDFSGALELVNKVLAIHPENARALAIRETCEHNLLQMYESRLGGTARRPRVVLSPDEVIWLNLDPRAGFVLAQIDGQVSFEDLYAICGLTHLDTARILSQLLDEGVIEAVGELNHLF